MILASRSQQKLEALKQKICKEVSSDSNVTTEQMRKLLPMQVDLGDYDSIDSFVEAVTKDFTEVTALVNNAGMHPGSTFTAGKYGFERSFQVNLVGPVVLTEKLLPLIKAAPDGRVINLSSLSHKEAPNPPEWEKIPRTAANFGGYDVDYCEAKWLLSMYTALLAKRLEAEGTSVKVMDADPGISPSSSMWDEQPLMLRIMARYLCVCLTHTTEQAAATAVKLCVEDAQNLKSGGYYTNGRFNVTGLPREDCVLPSNWEKFGDLMKKVLPQGLVSEETLQKLGQPGQRNEKAHGAGSGEKQEAQAVKSG